MVNIGTVKLDTNILAAPLAGCSDLAFRLICREHGARFCFYEMIDSNSLVRRRKGNDPILSTNELDAPIAGQILGSDPHMISDAAQRLTGLVKISFLDLNCACPVKKAIKKKAGAYLMRDKMMLGHILKRLVPGVNIPVTVKLRTGFDKTDHEDLSRIAKTCEASGVSAIFIHGRTRLQGYSGDIDYASIKTVKDSVKIPVFGSGNIFNPELAKKMLDDTSCDGIIVARGAMGNPWIFRDIEQYLATGQVAPTQDLLHRKEVLKRHLGYIEKYRNVKTPGSAGVMRKIAIWYTKNMPGAADMRNKLSRVKNYKEMLKTVEDLWPKSMPIQDRSCL
jgi:nifR3 family TIM-barrel protein